MASVPRRTLAVLLALVTITAPVTASVTAASPTPDSSPARNPSNQTASADDTRELGPNASALAYRAAAFKRLAHAANRTETRQPKLRKFREELNRSFQYHRDRHRVSDRAVFQVDKQVAAALSEHHPRIAGWLVDADQGLARTAVADAERVLATLSNRSVSFDRVQTTKSLRKARRALEKGNRLHQKGNGAAAIAHYRQAWTHAQTALDVLDAGVGPTVTVTNRSDPVQNGSANYTIRGTVFAVQPGEIDAVTILVNGEPREVRIQPGTVPGSTRRFAATVRLDARVVNLTVVAVDPEPGQPGKSERESSNPGTDKQAKKQGNGKNGKERGTGNGDTPTQGDKRSATTEWANQTDRAVLFVDGDGLPDRYETATTSTDPLNPNSDSRATDASEAGNGTHDGLEDYDGDGLVTLRERALTTDPLDADTDDDHLSDQAELVWTKTSPLAPDSDGDGTSDAREDPDNDTLANADEIATTANPQRADSDGDGLKDPTELDVGTEPHVFDTDADGLGDDAERHDPFNTDPLDADTDGDGTVDSNETYTTQAANESVGAAVSLTGEGNAARSVTIHNQTSSFQAAGVQAQAASSVVDIEAGANFSTANVTLQYDTSQVTATTESDLAVFRYNPKRQTFVKLDSSVDQTNGTVTAETSHFSVYTVFSTSEWASAFGSGLPSPWSVEKAFDRLGIWTCSGSCLTEGGTVIAGDIGSGGGSITGLNNNSTDDGGVHILCNVPLGGDCDIDDDGVQNGDDECESTYGEKANGCPRSRDYDDFDGDGVPNYQDECDSTPGDGPYGCPTDDDDNDDGGDGEDPEPIQHTEVTRTYSLAGVQKATVQLRVKASVSDSDSTVYVELGDQRVFEIDSVTSTDWTTITTDVSEYAGEAMTVRVVADNQSLVQVDSLKLKTHSDDDSIPDNIEEEGMPIGWGDVIITDPDRADTDGDGLADDQEIFVDQVVTHPQTGDRYYAWRSNPGLVHSDSDLLNDTEEIKGTTIPVVMANGEPLRYAPSQQNPAEMHVSSDALFADTDRDGLSDSDERRLHTDPREDVTYAVTKRHQRQVVDELYDRWKRHRDDGRIGAANYITESAQAMGLLPEGVSARRLQYVELTDATGDFDFVTADDGGYVFRALDHRKRTDTWLSNQRELGFTSPWDPDYDDDGLTDGQEVKGVTKVVSESTSSLEMLTVQPDPAHSYHTSPKDNDTDGYWDGWFGVYSVETSRNVVLYQDHLRDDDNNNGTTADDGLTPSERVPAQAGIHNLSKAPSAMGTDVDDDDATEHANIHIGELHWGTSPTGGSMPSPTLSLEVDYYNGTNYQPLNTESWEEGVEGNYRLYGISVRIIRDDVFTKDDLPICRDQWEGMGCIHPDDGWSFPEIIDTTDVLGDEPSDEYVMIVNEGDGLLGDYQSGVNLRSPYTEEALFIRGLSEDTDEVATDGFKGSPYNTRVAYVAALTQIHEAAHAVNIGRADDRFVPGTFLRNGEIYSGELRGEDDVKDRTPEAVRASEIWSVMASGFAEADHEPMAGRYFAFSIEELSTVKA